MEIIGKLTKRELENALECLGDREEARANITFWSDQPDTIYICVDEE